MPDEFSKGANRNSILKKSNGESNGGSHKSNKNRNTTSFKIGTFAKSNNNNNVSHFELEPLNDSTENAKCHKNTDSTAIVNSQNNFAFHHTHSDW